MKMAIAKNMEVQIYQMEIKTVTLWFLMFFAGFEIQFPHLSLTIEQLQFFVSFTSMKEKWTL